MVARIAITQGEPAGIGPNLICLIAQEHFDCELVVFGCKQVLAQRAKLLGLKINFEKVNLNQKSTVNQPGTIKLVNIPSNKLIKAGQLSQENAPIVLKSIETAFYACNNKLCDALVTGPIHKGIINKYKANFIGHTEYLSELSLNPKVMMTFYTPKIMLGLLTTHVPLTKVSSLITKELLTSSIKFINKNLQQTFNIANPKIAVLGLNPHAGENGVLGLEEQETIIPVISSLKNQGINVFGPIPADTAFNNKIIKDFDFILAMYHDQGLTPFKSLFFHECVNITLGLPIIRTSCAHGTALDLATSNNLSTSSFKQSIFLANNICKIKKNEILERQTF